MLDRKEARNFKKTSTLVVVLSVGVIARKTKELMCLHLVLIPPDYLLCPSRPVTIPEPFLGHVINAGTSGSCQNIIHVKMYISYITSS